MLTLRQKCLQKLVYHTIDQCSFHIKDLKYNLFSYVKHLVSICILQVNIQYSVKTMLALWLSILNYCLYFVELMYHFLTILHLSQHSCKQMKQQTNVQIMVPSQMNMGNKHKSSRRSNELAVISKLGNIPYPEVVYNDRLTLLANCTKNSSQSTPPSSKAAALSRISIFLNNVAIPQ